MQKDLTCPNRYSFIKRFSTAALTAALLISPFAQQVVTASSIPVVYQTNGWNGSLKVARLTQSQDLVVQLDLLNKPQTSYANAVYQVFARRNDQWVSVFTSSGARLITNAAGQTIPAPEVISMRDLQRQLGENIDFSRLELKVVAQLRYDIRGQVRDQAVQFEQVQAYRAIAQTTTTQLVTRTIATSKANFSLAIAQANVKSSKVVARISVKERTQVGFAEERLIGDFRYKVNKKAKFTRGLKIGDRVVVRLFNSDNQFIGYSEFELLSENSAVTLVLPERPTQTRIVRTVYGIDANEDFEIDANVQAFDYFTQITQFASQSYQSARVTFFSAVQSSTVNLFNVAGLPAPRPTCNYPVSFSSGSFLMVNRTFQVFQSSLNSAIVILPGQRTIDISSTEISTHEVNPVLVSTPVDAKKPKKKHCNQGIGNGSEGCDPGNSRPHGGSNDEGGRKPGKHKR